MFKPQTRPLSTQAKYSGTHEDIPRGQMMRTEKDQLENTRVAGSKAKCWGDHTVLQLLVLGEGPIRENIGSGEYCPGVLQHLQEPHVC